MKKEPVQINSEQQNNAQQMVIQELQKGLGKMDSFPIDTPSLQWFEQMVLNEKQLMKKRLAKDLAIFLMIALFVLSGIAFSLSQLPILFFIMQVITILFLIGYIILRYVRKVNKG